MMAIIVRGRASPEPFRVCTKRGLPPSVGRKRILARRAWKSSKRPQDETSNHSSDPGAQVSRSILSAAAKPRSPVLSGRAIGMDEFDHLHLVELVAPLDAAHIPPG